MVESHQCLFSFSLPRRLPITPLTSFYRPPESISSYPSVSAFTPLRPDRLRVSAVEETADVVEEVEDGPIELPPSAISSFSSTNSIFATFDDPIPLQSSGAKKSLKDEAMEKLKEMGSAPIEQGGGKSSPSAAQAFLGVVSAGVIAVILYKFTTTIEAELNRHAISDNFSCTARYIHDVKDLFLQ
ncbi:hypothetical protein Bca52824_002390 [Brassica carinata]|uniref:Uncharacterized protein n=1 Tax=Brassica carinata TaxID=52824 RepID=A0A8X8BDU3_BRACI|nr:hypothetical protein Bca52824_002390 [Brassica carinata]